MDTAQLTDLVIAVCHILNALLLAVMLVATRRWRVGVMSRMTDLRLRRAVSSLGATLWLFPAMFLLGGTNRLLGALGRPWPELTTLYAASVVLAAVQLTAAVLFFARRASRVRAVV